MEIKFDGLDQLVRELENTERDVEKSKQEALEAGGKLLQQRTKEKAPHKTGVLEGEIQLSDVADGQIDVYVDNQGRAYYGSMHEFGTSKMRARPFMGPTFNQSISAIENEMAISIKKSLRAFV